MSRSAARRPSRCAAGSKSFVIARRLAKRSRATRPKPCADTHGWSSSMAIHAADFRELRLDRLSRQFGAMVALRDVSLTVQRGEFIALLGPVRLRQIHHAELPGGVAARHRRRHLAGRAPHRQPAAGAARLRHGVPELRPVPAHERATRTSASASSSAGCPRPRSTRRVMDAAKTLVRPAGSGKLPRPALRRPAAAGGGRRGPSSASRRVPVRRAAVQPRRQAAGDHAGRAQAAAPAAEDDHDLRHARPGRGDDAGRPHRRA